MASCVFAVSVLALLTGCSRAREVSEHELYASETWHSDSLTVLVRAQGEMTQRCVAAIQSQFALSVTIHNVYI